MNLESYLQKVKTNNPQAQAFVKSLEAAQSRKLQGDMVLAPALTAKVGYLSDANPSSQPSSLSSKLVAQDYSLGLAKKFSTGTGLSLSSSNRDVQLTLPTTVAKSNTNYWNMSATQSLWKDGFGYATTLRHQREDWIARAESLGAQVGLEQILVDAEVQFWDWLYLNADHALKVTSLNRANELDVWMKRRFEIGTADKSDYLQIQALVASRQLQKISSEDELKAQELKIRSLLGGNELLPPLEENLKIPRQVFVGQKLRLDALASKYEAQTKEVVVNEVKESVKPDLALEASYSSFPTTAVALKLTMPFDDSSISGAINAALYDSESARLKAKRKDEESSLAWSELQRRHKEMSNRIEVTKQLVEVQKSKAAREREKLLQGRTTTFQVINFEQEAQESEVGLLKLHVEQRKLEAQARLFGDAK